MASDVESVARAVRAHRIGHLSPLMQNILALNASDMRNGQIAERLHISYSTVINTLAESRDRLGVVTIGAAIMRAHAMGYLSHPTGADAGVIVLG